MSPAQRDPTGDRNPRDYRANRAQVNQPEEIVLHPHVGAKKNSQNPAWGLG
jgi:hypothetical protein